MQPDDEVIAGTLADVVLECDDCVRSAITSGKDLVVSPSNPIAGTRHHSDSAATPLHDLQVIDEPPTVVRYHGLDPKCGLEMDGDSLGRAAEGIELEPGLQHLERAYDSGGKVRLGGAG